MNVQLLIAWLIVIIVLSVATGIVGWLLWLIFKRWREWWCEGLIWLGLIIVLFAIGWAFHTVGWQ